MTPLPKKKHTRSRSNIRRNAPTNRLVLPNFVACKSCGKPRISHTACKNCGKY